MKYLGVDWGLKRIGLALSEGTLASPLMTLKINGLEDGVGKVVEVVTKEQVGLVIMGKPEGEMGKAVEKAAGKLKGKGVKVELADETLSTQKAIDSMIEMGVSKKDRKDDNAVSAAIILQEYLDVNNKFKAANSK